MATGGSRPSAVTSVRRLGHASVRETYPTTTAKIKGRREEIVIVDETGASVDGYGRLDSRSSAVTSVRRYGRGSYLISTDNGKGRREDIVIVDETGASVDGNGRQSIATGRAIVRRYGRGSYSYGRS